MEDTKPQELAGTGYEIFVGALSLLSIINIVLVAFMRDSATPYVIYAVDWVLSIIFLGDFLMRLRRAPSGWDYFLRQFGWADLLASLPFPQVKILRVFRLVRVIRLLRQYGPRQIGASLLRDRASSALLSLLLIAILVLEFGSLWMLHIESSAPEANITTASDALWYVIVTMSTVGYGDQYPVTNAGRELGTVIIVVGVGIFGTLTGYLANLFLSPTRSEEAAATEAAATEPAATEPAATLPYADAAIDLRLARLARAGELRASGVITMTEFETAKAEIMSS